MIYSKRYFNFDTVNMNFKYSKEACDIDRNPQFVEDIRNVLSVKKNLVSMPSKNKNTGIYEFKEISIFDTVHNLDRGPDDGINFNVVEIKTK